MPGVLALYVGIVDLDLERVDAGENAPDQTIYGVPQDIELGATLRDGQSGEMLVELLEVSRSHHEVLESADGVVFWGDIRDAFSSWTGDCGRPVWSPPARR